MRRRVGLVDKGPFIEFRPSDGRETKDTVRFIGVLILILAAALFLLRNAAGYTLATIGTAAGLGFILFPQRFIARRAARRDPAGRCPCCGHDLRATPEPDSTELAEVCPECGFAVPPPPPS